MPTVAEILERERARYSDIKGFYKNEVDAAQRILEAEFRAASVESTYPCGDFKLAIRFVGPAKPDGAPPDDVVLIVEFMVHEPDLTVTCSIGATHNGTPSNPYRETVDINDRRTIRTIESEDLVQFVKNQMRAAWARWPSYLEWRANLDHGGVPAIAG